MSGFNRTIARRMMRVSAERQTAHGVRRRLGPRVIDRFRSGWSNYTEDQRATRSSLRKIRRRKAAAMNAEIKEMLAGMRP